jgi:dTDP-4-dehydrorhamnose reductase
MGGGGRGIIVRVPLLYGEDCVDLNESPALEAMSAFLPHATTLTAKGAIDHWATRFPTSCEDVSRVLTLVIDRMLEGVFPSQQSGADARPGDTYHISSPHGTTKYELMHLQARVLDISMSDVDERIEPCDGGRVQSNNTAPRPKCTQLDCSATWEALGLDEPFAFDFASLESGMKRALGGFPERFAKGGI